MSMRITASSYAASIALATWICAALSAQGLRPDAVPASGTRIVSPSVLATWISARDPSGAPTLDLLVLWRGTAGWFTKGAPGGDHTGGQPSGRTVITVQRGGVHLEVVFDPRLRVVRVQGTELRLQKANVILVDDVDSSGGPRIVGTRSVDPALSDSARIEPVFRRSPELVAYLRCDAPLHDSPDREILERVCAQVLGK